MSLVETDWLEKNINSVKIIDCSWHMPQTKRNGLKEYKNQHIPILFFLTQMLTQEKKLIYHTCQLAKKIGCKLYQKWE